MHRFFVDGPLVAGQDVALSAEVAHQVGRVLRLRPGDRILLLDGSGWEYPVELIDLAARQGHGRVEGGRPTETEPRVAVTLYAAPLKGDHYAYTLQKATEIGAAAFVPTVTARTVVGEVGATKVERWRRIAREAAEQSGRGRLPTVGAPVPFAEACRLAAAAGPALIPWEEAREPSLSATIAAWRAERGQLAQLGLLIGPEGGFTAEEIALAQRCGIVPVTLGRRILRAETAAAVATTLALAALGDLDTRDDAP
ncbi:MAG: 16S rRNA (uracil(1498)-N(3))-methyltransferase [uncultured Thermomicrobiales bacterium]|uniref:Ribosomal RNA small subunit methyltransferase E n=1 Tax=uncultured Thermomicrobiales bacterium TaxID=1645740 RepID=A0A6J4UJD1_9BACT|nr:MAG: 16S rRNA (uracil(1498)-N(3))-methyltransferase [uncultured Thermomicrobiales bacterium]